MSVEQHSESADAAEGPAEPVYAQYVNGRRTQILTLSQARVKAGMAMPGKSGSLDDPDGLHFHDYYPGQGRRNFHICRIDPAEAQRWLKWVSEQNRARRWK